MPRYRIEYDMAHCEGNFNCINEGPFFVANPGGTKADLVDSDPAAPDMKALRVLEIEEEDLEAALEAAAVCPPQVIRVRDLESGLVLAGPEQLPIEEERGRPAPAPTP